MTRASSYALSCPWGKGRDGESRLRTRLRARLEHVEGWKEHVKVDTKLDTKYFLEVGDRRPRNMAMEGSQIRAPPRSIRVSSASPLGKGELPSLLRLSCIYSKKNGILQSGIRHVYEALFIRYDLKT